MIDWLACVLVKLIGGLLCRLPVPIAVWLGERFGGLTAWLQPKRTRIGLGNLRAAFGDQLPPQQARRIIRACYRQLGATLVELLRLPVIDRAYVERYVTVEGRDRFEAAIKSGRPMIFLTGHFGNWELSSIFAALEGYPITALARAQSKFPKLYQLLVSYRESKGCKIIHKGGAMKRLLAALEQRQLVGIVGDQASRQGIFIDFFGRPALFATGPFELAYKEDALILPAFMHRVRGPFHRFVIESPIELPRELVKDQAVRAGVRAFARVLSQHIAEEPSQWLWVHKRWKHTSARRILVLSDGKLGHLKQSLAVLELLQEQATAISSEVIEVRYRSRLARAVALLWSWWVPGGAWACRVLEWTLHPQTAESLLRRYADVIISCGSSTIPVNLLWALENRAKSVVIMNPHPVPLRRFSLVIAPRHDGLPQRPNVVHTVGAIAHRLRDDEAAQAKSRLQHHSQFRPLGDVTHPHPVCAVFIGGDTLHYEVNQAFAEALVAQVKAACEAVDGWYLVTTSRRTTPSVERWLTERASRDPRCRLLLIATHDPIDGTMDGMLGSADVSVVTGESISMVSEACASGRRVLVVEPPLRHANASTLTKHQRFLHDVVKEGYARKVAIPELGMTIQRVLKERQPTKPLDNFAKVREAVRKLLS